MAKEKSKIGYQCVEQTNKQGVHYIYARPIFNSFPPSFKKLCEDACENTTYEVSTMMSCVREYMKVVQKYTQLGYRTPLGEDFLVVYPMIDLSIKDYQDPSTGQTIVVTEEMMNSRNATSRLGCTVNPSYSKEFAENIKWVKTSKTGQTIDDDETDITQNNGTPDAPADTSTNTQPSGGDDIPAGNG